MGQLGFTLAPETLTQLARIGVPVWFDGYVFPPDVDEQELSEDADQDEEDDETDKAPQGR
jgi:hypothetical protein